MSSPSIEHIVEEVKKLPPDEQRQLRERLDREAPPEPRRSNIRWTGEAIDLSRELRWIDEHRAEYAGQWVAVRGDRLLSHGTDGVQVYREARAAGDDRPFVTWVEPPDQLPFAGW